MIYLVVNKDIVVAEFHSQDKSGLDASIKYIGNPEYTEVIELPDDHGFDGVPGESMSLFDKNYIRIPVPSAAVENNEY